MHNANDSYLPITSKVNVFITVNVSILETSVVMQVYSPSWESCSGSNVSVRVVTLPDDSGVPSVTLITPSSPVHPTVGVPVRSGDMVTVQVRVYCSPATESPPLVAISKRIKAGRKKEDNHYTPHFVGNIELVLHCTNDPVSITDPDVASHMYTPPSDD